MMNFTDEFYESRSFVLKKFRFVLWKKVLLEILPNSQENTCVRVSFSQSSRAILRRKVFL